MFFEKILVLRFLMMSTYLSQFVRNYGGWDERLLMCFGILKMKRMGCEGPGVEFYLNIEIVIRG
jgi:hypothetical protein